MGLLTFLLLLLLVVLFTYFARLCLWEKEWAFVLTSEDDLKESLFLPPAM